MSTYKHDHKDSNLSGAHKALKYDADGEPSLRVSIENIETNAGKGTGLATSRYAADAWGRSKAILDYSIFSATWTFSVPARVWDEVSWDYINEIPVLQPTFTKVSSREHMLSVLSGTSAGNGTVCRSRDFMRYQPNRGQLFSTAVTCPTPTDNCSREWGLSTADNGVMFELIGDGADWDMVVTRRRHATLVETTSIKEFLPEDFDPGKGHVYDIQYEWRGVGNFFFYVDLELVYTMDILGSLDFLSVNDPALPVAFVSTTFVEGQECELLASCVDVTSEGGTDPRTLFATADTGDALVTLGAASTDTAILAIKVPRTLVYNGGVFNSRGAIMDKLVTWTRDESLTKAYHFKSITATNLDGLTWTDMPDSPLQYLSGGTGDPLDVAYQLDVANGQRVVAEWADIDEKNIITNPAENSDFSVVPGDILVITVRSTGAANVKSSATLYFSEQL